MLKRNLIQKTGPKRKGQSTIEYIILVAAIIGALIFFLKPGGIFQKAFNQTYNTGTQGMVNMANRLAGSRP